MLRKTYVRLWTHHGETSPAAIATASVTDSSRVAVIGVGRMGAPMARRLLSAGHTVSVCDPTPAAVQALCARGSGPSRGSG